MAEPEGGPATVCYVAAPVPLLVVPTLHGEDGVDGTTVSFLLAENLKLQKEEEKEKAIRVALHPFAVLC